MAIFSDEGIRPAVQQRILDFLNNARTPDDITGDDQVQAPVLDDPNSGEGDQVNDYTIGDIVAERIITKRASLVGGRYNSVEELSNIPGFGLDKFNDLVYTFSMSSAERFKLEMYKNVILDNWELEYDLTEFADEAHFLNIVDNESEFREFVSRRLVKISFDQYQNQGLADVAGTLLNGLYIDKYFSGFIGAYALALWFFRFDADNWFSYNRVQDTCSLYLDGYSYVRDRRELRLFKGYPNAGVIANSVTVDDLPVVVDYAQRSIAIWRATLND